MRGGLLPSQRASQIDLSRRNLTLYLPYHVASIEGVMHGLYLLWWVGERGISPAIVAMILASGDLALGPPFADVAGFSSPHTPVSSRGQ